MRATGLYKQLLRYGQQLELTDQQYYFRRIRSEFQKNRNETDPKLIKHQIEKGAAFLRNGLLL